MYDSSRTDQTPVEAIPVGQPEGGRTSTTMNYVDPRAHIAKGTSFHATLGWGLFWITAVVGFVFSVVVTWGIALLFWIASPFFYKRSQRRARAMIHGSALLVGPDQFPEVHEAVQRLSRQLRIQSVPDILIMESSEQNAAALKTGSRAAVILTDEMVQGAISTGDPKVLDFIIGHELSHHALGHTGLFRGMMSSKYRPLSRLDEFTCDAVADALVESKQSAAMALALLAVGPQLLPKVNLKALLSQAQAVVADKESRKSEKMLTHPLLLRRFGRICGLEVK